MTRPQTRIPLIEALLIGAHYRIDAQQSNGGPKPLRRAAPILSNSIRALERAEGQCSREAYSGWKAGRRDSGIQIWNHPRQTLHGRFKPRRQATIS
ncbi:MAG: hypothetical protein JWQ42_2369 [Edaphobacter sp.]|nr:hypothetical protein [Edaphobacter sp.]